MWKRISFELSKMTKFDHHIPLTWHQKVSLKRNRLELIFRCASLKNGWGTISNINSEKCWCEVDIQVQCGFRRTFNCALHFRLQWYRGVTIFWKHDLSAIFDVVPFLHFWWECLAFSFTFFPFSILTDNTLWQFLARLHQTR